MKKLVEFKNLTIALGERVLFENLNFSLNEGDSFMFLGENGIGKSLLMEIIALGNWGDLRQRYQGLKIQGDVVNGNGESLLDVNVKRSIAYVTQDENFYNNSTILSEAENACVGMGMELDDGKLERLLRYFDIKTDKKKKIRNNLSYGEGKVIHLILNILKLGRANMLLLDEPLNHLSFKNSKRLNDLMLKIKEERPDLAILIISHCSAIKFVDKALCYDYNEKRMKITEYCSYDCFNRV
jgi:ABC-type multidrug transport system ATPase subunit